MAVKYIYNNDGSKVKYHGNQEPVLYSGPYRYIETVKEPKTTSKTTKTSAGSKTVTTATPTAAVSSGDNDAENRRKEKINAINARKSNEKNLLDQNYQAQKNQAQLDNEDNLRQLYIAYMQGLQGIPQQSAVWGAGGEIESLKNRSRLNYETNRAKENRSYAGVLGDIQAKYSDDLRQLEQKYLQLLLDV